MGSIITFWKRRGARGSGAAGDTVPGSSASSASSVSPASPILPAASLSPGRSDASCRSDASSRSHAHGHSHGRALDRAVSASPLVRYVTLGLLALVAGSTAWGMVALWPDGSDVARVADRAMYVAEGVTFERGEVLRVEDGCDRGVPAGSASESDAAGGTSEAGETSEAGAGRPSSKCQVVGVGLRTGADSGRYIEIELRGALASAGIRSGDHLELMAFPAVAGVDPAAGTDPGSEAGAGADADDPAEAADPDTAPSSAADPDAAPGPTASYEIARGYDATGVFRGWPLVLLTLVFAVVVVAVGRWRGLLALVALGVAAGVLLMFVLPALVAGEPGLLVAIVGSSAIMFATLYFVHGPNLRTTAALIGTLCGILIMAGISLVAVHATRLSGIGDEASGRLAGMAAEIDFRGLLTCAIIIAGLGVLNDVTITQASSVWELRAAAPGMPRSEVYARAMRIGRDHIASTVYTVFFAYVGAAMSVLILLYLYNRPMLSLLTHEDIVTEIVRTLCGSVGLVLAVPITTGVAVLFLPPEERLGGAPIPGNHGDGPRTAAAAGHLAVT